MKFLLPIGTAVLASLTVSLPTLAQSTIEALRSPNSVTLSGQVTQIRGDDFVLDDGTGQILVDAESRALRQVGLSIGDTVTVLGRYDDNEFEAISITPVGGETVYIFDD
jgi:uncharacterized protein YdeI (BOF family)